MRHTVKLPQLGETSHAVVILDWLVDVGEALMTHRLAWAVAEATRTGAAVPVGAR